LAFIPGHCHSNARICFNNVTLTAPHCISYSGFIVVLMMRDLPRCLSILTASDPCHSNRLIVRVDTRGRDIRVARLVHKAVEQVSTREFQHGRPGPSVPTWKGEPTRQGHIGLCLEPPGPLGTELLNPLVLDETRSRSTSFGSFLKTFPEELLGNCRTDTNSSRLQNE
jgi:hypothetical protein